jgi:hypothetical protein
MVWLILTIPFAGFHCQDFEAMIMMITQNIPIVVLLLNRDIQAELPNLDIL